MEEHKLAEGRKALLVQIEGDIEERRLDIQLLEQTEAVSRAGIDLWQRMGEKQRADRAKEDLEGAISSLALFRSELATLRAARQIIAALVPECASP